MQIQPINAIENNKDYTCESEKPSKADQNFQKILEIEQTKLGFAPLMINFDSFYALIPLGNYKNKVLDIHKASLDFDVRNKSIANIYGDNTRTHKTETQNNVQNKNAISSDTSKSHINANQTKSVQDKLNNVFYVNLKAMPELHNIMLQTKSRIPGLKEVSLEDLLSEIIDKAKVIKENEKTELILKLKPEKLGNILISIVKEKGNLAISIYAKESTKELLEQDLAKLEKSLRNANINISGLQVSINDQKRNKHMNDDETLSIPTIESLMYNNEQLKVELVDNVLIEEALGLRPFIEIYSAA